MRPSETGLQIDLMSARAVPRPEPSSAPLSDVLKKCDNALNDCRVVISKKDDIIKEQQAALESSSKRTADLENESDKVINSKPLWLAIGMVVMKLILIL